MSFKNPCFETFQILFYHRTVEDFLTDEIQLYILNQEQENGAEKPQPDKHHLLPRSVPACSNPSMLKLEESGETDKNTLSLHHQDCRTFIVYHLVLGTPKKLRGWTCTAVPPASKISSTFRYAIKTYKNYIIEGKTFESIIYFWSQPHITYSIYMSSGSMINKLRTYFWFLIFWLTLNKNVWKVAKLYIK